MTYEEMINRLRFFIPEDSFSHSPNTSPVGGFNVGIHSESFAHVYVESNGNEAEDQWFVEVYEDDDEPPTLWLFEHPEGAVGVITGLVFASRDK